MTRRKHRGFGLMAALIVMGIAIALVGVLTTQLASLTDRTARYSRGVCARALAEAGVEAVLARLAREPEGAFNMERALQGGKFDAHVDVLSGKKVINSTGRVDLSGSVLTCRITIELAPAKPGDMKPRILSRVERTDCSRR